MGHLAHNANLSVTGTSFVDTNVTNGHRYYYVVSSVDAAGAGPNSAEVSAMPFELVAWFAADGLTGMTSGGNVSNWPDLSWNGNNATQPIAGNQPVYVTGAMNGKPWKRPFVSNILAWPVRP